MKTHIIQLEHHDDLVSACDKMNWARGGRILLVWPEGRPVLNRRLDLTLLKRRAAALGAPLALVSKDAEVQYYAPRLGIPVFRSQRKAQDANWRLPRRFRQPSLSAGYAGTAAPEPAETAAVAATADAMGAETVAPAEVLAGEAVRQARPPASRPERPMPEKDLSQRLAATSAARLAFFALGVVAMLAIAAVLLPGATVRVAPQTQVQEALIEIIASPQTASVDIGGSLPARWVTVTVEGRDTLAAGGQVEVPESSAGGEIVFTNLTDQAVQLPSGTVVVTEGETPVRFATTRPGLTPPGPGQSVRLPAEALEPGERGNVGANRLTAIEGLVGAQVSANNPQPMRGGRSLIIPAPSDDDRRQLTERLMAALEVTALQELQRGLGEEDVLIAASLERVETIEETVQPRPGMPAERLSLSLRLEYRALAVTGDDLRRLAETVFDANLPAGTAALDGSLRIEALDSPQGVEGGYRFRLHTHRQISARLSQEQVIASVLGRSPEQAAQALETQLAMDEPAQIEVQPRWWPRLPVLPFRIQVVYAYLGR